MTRDELSILRKGDIITFDDGSDAVCMCIERWRVKLKAIGTFANFKLQEVRLPFGSTYWMDYRDIYLDYEDWHSNEWLYE